MKNEDTIPAEQVPTKQPTLAVVAAVIDDECLKNNLAASPMLAVNNVPLIIKRGYKSTSLAYNDGLDCADADIVIFAHQDVYFPRGWEKKLLSVIRLLEQRGENWGVLGVIGANGSGDLVGGAWSTGMRLKIESEFISPSPVRSFDEIVLVLRKDNGLRFDEDLPNWHIYGTDIALSAIEAGMGAYVFDAPVIHNSIRHINLAPGYFEAYRYMQSKWRHELPVHTLILPLTAHGWPVVRNWLREKKRWVVRQFKPMPPRVRHPDPAGLAAKLGYEPGK